MLRMSDASEVDMVRLELTSQVRASMKGGLLIGSKGIVVRPPLILATPR